MVIKGDLILEGCQKLVRLVGIIEIKGDLKIGGFAGSINFEDFGDLKIVGGDLFLHRTNVTSLQKIEEIGGSLIIRGEKITDLGNLKKVGRTIAGFDESKMWKYPQFKRKWAW